MAVLITADAREQLDALPRPIRRRVMGIFERLQQWPEVSGVKALRGERVGQYRIRTGDYRVVFTADDEDVTVIKIGDRKDVYLD